MRFRVVMVCSAVVGLLAAAAPAKAALITGQLVISGNFTYNNLVLTTGNPGDAGLDFEPSIQLPPPPNSPTEAAVVVDSGLGYFATVGGTGVGLAAAIKNITDVTPPTNVNYAFLPDGVVQSPAFPNFLSNFSLAPSLHFDVTEFVHQGSTCPATPSCDEGPFNLTQTATGFDISFDFLGVFINGPDSGLYSAHFVTSIAGLTFDELQARLLGPSIPGSTFGEDIGCANSNGNNNGNTESCGFTATFSPIESSAVPEPATLVTFGLGSLALAAVRRRKAKKQ